MNRNFRKIAVLLLIVLMIAGSIYANQKLDAVGKKNLRSGKMHKNGKRYEKAIPLFEKVLEENPNHIEAAEKLGDIYYSGLKDYEKAYKYLKLAIENIDKEIAEYKKLQQEKPKKKKKYQKHIDKYLKEKAKLEKYLQSSWAKMYIKASSVINPKALGSEPTKENFTEALQRFMHLYKITPDSAKTLKMIGYCYTKLDSSDKAIEYLKLSLAKKEDYITRAKLADMYFKKKDYANAAKQYEKLIELDPKKPDNYYNICLVYNDLNDYDKALKAIDKFLELKPDDKDGYLLAVQTASKKNPDDLNAQIKYYKKYTDLSLDDASALQTMASLYYKNKDYKNSLDYAIKWFELSKSKDALELVVGAAFKAKEKEKYQKYSKMLKNFK